MGIGGGIPDSADSPFSQNAAESILVNSSEACRKRTDGTEGSNDAGGCGSTEGS